MSAHSVEGVETEVSGLAREVALHRAVIVAVVTFAVNLAVSQHWITLGLSSEVLRYVDDALTFAGVVGAGAWIRTATTPADQSLQPVNSDGQALVPDPAAADAFDADQTTDPDLTTAFDAPTDPASATDPTAHTDTTGATA